MLSIVPGTALAQESVWTDMAPATGPPPRAGHDMAYDAESDRIVLFGGMASSDRNPTDDDTWAYDFNTNTWSDMEPGVRPSPRRGHAMAYDAESDRVILFGGMLFGGTPSPETWAYDFNANTWTNMSPALQPAAWFHVGMAYDTESDRIVLFGGCDEASLNSRPYWSCVGTLAAKRDETWAYDYDANTWTDMSPGRSPPGRSWHRLAYDAESDRVILFGGWRDGPLGDTWAYHLNANLWIRMSPVAAPLRRDVYGMAYDASADRIILFGGSLGARGPYKSDAWAYSLEGDTWTRTDSGMGPSPRAVPRLAYDTESDRIVLFGGDTSSTGTEANDETWAHQLVPPPLSIPPWVYIAIGVVAAAVVAVVAVYLTRRRRRMRKGGEGE